MSICAINSLVAGAGDDGGGGQPQFLQFLVDPPFFHYQQGVDGVLSTVSFNWHGPPAAFTDQPWTMVTQAADLSFIENSQCSIDCITFDTDPSIFTSDPIAPVLDAPDALNVQVFNVGRYANSATIGGPAIPPFGHSWTIMFDIRQQIDHFTATIGAVLAGHALLSIGPHGQPRWLQFPNPAYKPIIIGGSSAGDPQIATLGLPSL